MTKSCCNNLPYVQQKEVIHSTYPDDMNADDIVVDGCISDCRDSFLASLRNEMSSYLNTQIFCSDQYLES